MDGESIEFGECYARFDGRRLAVGNGRIERVWRFDAGQPYAESFRDKEIGAEWLARPARRPAPVPPAGVPLPAGALAWRTRTGRAHPVQEPSLVAEVFGTQPGGAGKFAWRFQVFPGLAGIVLQAIAPDGSDAERKTEDGERKADAGGIERAPANEADDALPCADAIEHFVLAPVHLRLTEVTFMDRTDVHNALVHEREWLLHTAEGVLALSGNLFAVEDVLTGNGLVFFKHAPLSHARPVPAECDLRVGARRGVGFRAGSEAYGFGYEFGFYGHGMGQGVGEGYRCATLSYRGGPWGRTRALHACQRRFRPFVDGRDGVFVSNTWGDRSRDSRIREAFLAGEIDAGARLGVDVVQIDDGWQRGRTANSATAGGVWTGFWAADARFWEPHPERLPAGLGPLVTRARERGMQFGLWFAPDSWNDLANWERDAGVVLDYHRGSGVRYFKLDGLKVHTKRAERNLRRFIDRVLTESGGAVVFDLDVTAETRPGYFGALEAGPVFVENRYTDWHRYWPHQTLRNLWMLARHVDPVRLRMEFLNPARNAELYGDDPLAPGRYPPAYLFATAMAASPLGWFEVSNLPDACVAAIAPVARVWREHRAAWFGGCICPVGEPPDGTAWTGFCSVSEAGRAAYLLAYREFNDRRSREFPLPGVAPDGAADVLAGAGSVRVRGGRAEVAIPEPRGFVFAKLAET